MTAAKQPTNPFYVVLIVVGTAFVLTSCCYFVMTVQSREVSLGRSANDGRRQFAELVDRHGFTALMIELGILAVATVAAIATDEYWTNRRAERDEDNQHACPGDATASGETPEEVSS